MENPSLAGGEGMNIPSLVLGEGMDIPSLVFGEGMEIPSLSLFFVTNLCFEHGNT